jgi:uncharacterized membrane protein YdfJ with MMPL/SSD domain
MTRFSIDRAFERIARAIVRFRWLVLVLWLLAAAGSGAQASQTRAIGLGLAAGILMDTFLVRTLLVPATVILLDRWNWWPSAMARAGGHRPDPGSDPRSARAGDPAEVRS